MSGAMIPQLSAHLKPNSKNKNIWAAPMLNYGNGIFSGSPMAPLPAPAPPVAAAVNPILPPPLPRNNFPSSSSMTTAPATPGVDLLNDPNLLFAAMAAAGLTNPLPAPQVAPLPPPVPQQSMPQAVTDQDLENLRAEVALAALALVCSTEKHSCGLSESGSADSAEGKQSTNLEVLACTILAHPDDAAFLGPDALRPLRAVIAEVYAKEDEDCVMICRHVSKLGYKAPDVLARHFQNVTKVYPVFSLRDGLLDTIDPKGTIAKPANMAYVVFDSPQACQRALMSADHGLVHIRGANNVGLSVKVQKFHRNDSLRNKQQQQQHPHGHDNGHHYAPASATTGCSPTSGMMMMPAGPANRQPSMY